MSRPLRRPGNEIHAVELTTHSVSDAQIVKPLVAAVEWPIGKLSDDGAYDQVKVYDELARHHIQPRSNAVTWTDKAGVELAHPLNEALAQIKAVGLAQWKRQSDYHRRSKAETAMFRWKATFGDHLSARLLVNHQSQA